ncbi:signal recognition particle subunit SRP9 (SRP9) [Babesia microti strain RI]|uniref:Signal recognition particle subunit SRP9 (SRP9) n=1 Tax=Babesia microti (strain RI) TaxID=1133968 RepID=A0A0K3AUW4_BABMR|nr:signal recognition particle subunit SRP9 (SRP9) [Babesia microti strain RI]CTQ41391.1 signal recognition particle subunit SRP9 (SRP9) [Babesia microti strain RI]|eukprot:XP_012649402.1 signal recognition particle subunit SRP9 (SRP9) [Babesia microti strain RI]
MGYAMTFYENFSEFLAAAKELYASNPTKTRYSIKLKKGDPETIVKVTNDLQCHKIRINRDSHSRRLDQLSELFMNWATIDIVDIESLPLKIEPAKKSAKVWNKKK